MKLYKFRPLATDVDLERATTILSTGKFWCSRFWDLNDPMEGVYSFDANTLQTPAVADLFSAKETRLICSFSGENAFSDPRLWGYYANGFKGIAIEIESDCSDANIRKVTYSSEVTQISNRDESVDAVTRILTTKLWCWQHEHEYRYLADGDSGQERVIGTITAVFFGDPYRTLVNSNDFAQQGTVGDYYRRVQGLELAIANLNNINMHTVRVRDGRVEQVSSADSMQQP